MVSLHQLDGWAESHLLHAREWLVYTNGLLAELVGPAIAQPAWRMTEAVCVWTLGGFRIFVERIANGHVRKTLMFEYDKWPTDGSRGPAPGPDWRRQVMCPNLAAEGLEDSDTDCEVSAGQPCLRMCLWLILTLAAVALSAEKHHQQLLGCSTRRCRLDNSHPRRRRDHDPESREHVRTGAQRRALHKRADSPPACEYCYAHDHRPRQAEGGVMTGNAREHTNGVSARSWGLCGCLARRLANVEL